MYCCKFVGSCGRVVERCGQIVGDWGQTVGCCGQFVVSFKQAIGSRGQFMESFSRFVGHCMQVVESFGHAVGGCGRVMGWCSQNVGSYGPVVGLCWQTMERWGKLCEAEVNLWGVPDNLWDDPVELNNYSRQNNTAKYYFDVLETNFKNKLSWLLTINVVEVLKMWCNKLLFYFLLPWCKRK